MSKEYLEAFKIVYNNFDYLISDVCIENDDVNICLKTIKEQLPTIKRALQRLEANDNAEPSEALEDLEALEQDIKDRVILAEDRQLKLCAVVKQALLKAQENIRSEEILQKYYQEGITLDSVRALKQEKDYYKKVLEIIKEKNVAVALLKSCRTVNAYNILAFDDEYLKANNYLRKLTQEEFNLLKEVLE